MNTPTFLNTVRFRLMALVGLLVFPLFAELRVGDDRLKVFEILGEPKGRIEMGDLERLFYDRGEVRLREGQVSEIDLISQEAAQTQREQQARESEARRERGERLKAERLADPEFRARPAAERFAFWRDFRQEFPEVDVFAPYTDAKAAAEQDAERQRTAERLAQVERRVADAEFRARQAENAARTLNTSTRVEYVTPYPIIYTRNHRRSYPHYPYPHNPYPFPPGNKPTPAPDQPKTHIRIERTATPFTTSGGVSTAEPLSGFPF